MLRDKRLAHIERLGASERQTRKLPKPRGSGTPLLTPRQLILGQRTHNRALSFDRFGRLVRLSAWVHFLAHATSPLTEQTVLLNLRRCVGRSSSCPALISIRGRDPGATSHAATTAGDLDLFLRALCPGDSFEVEPALGPWVDSEPTSLASIAPFCVRAASAGRRIVLNEDQMERVAAFDNLSSRHDGEVSMQVAQLHKAKKHRLRIVFRDRVVSFGVADLSLGEVARTLREQVPKHYGEPVSIDCIQSSRSSD